MMKNDEAYDACVITLQSWLITNTISRIVIYAHDIRIVQAIVTMVVNYKHNVYSTVVRILELLNYIRRHGISYNSKIFYSAAQELNFILGPVQLNFLL